MNTPEITWSTLTDPHPYAGLLSGPCDYSQSFIAALGVEIVCFWQGWAEIRLPVRDGQCNTWGSVHGGVVMTLLDTSMALAGRSRDERAQAGVTVEMKTSFLQPARGPLRAIAYCRHRSTTLAFCEAEVRSADGSVAAHAMGTFKYLRAVDRTRFGSKLRGDGGG